VSDQPFRRLQRSLVRLLTLDLEEYSKFPAWILRQIKVCYYVAVEFIRDRCLLRASSLTYTTLLSLVPLMVVSFSWFSRLKLSEEEVQKFLSRYLFPDAQLFENIQNNIDTFSENAAALSTFGTLFLFVTAYSMINTMEKSFNAIWHVTETRTLWDKVSSFWMALTLAPILIGLSLFMTARLKTLPVLGSVLEYPVIKALLVYLIPFVMIWFAFFMLYKLLPYTQVRTYAAIGGAGVGAFLFSLCRWGFGIYITHFASYSKIYGALAAVPAFLLYLFLVWIIVLLGGEFSYVLQYPEIYQKGASGGFRPENYRGYFALRAMIELVRGFRSGEKPVELLEISQRLGISFELAEQLLNQLKTNGLLQRLENRSAFVPARDPERISAADVVEAVRGKLLEVAPSSDTPEQQAIEKIFGRGSAALQEHLGTVTLSTLVAELEAEGRGPEEAATPLKPAMGMNRRGGGPLSP
jgi:membrane protein